MTTPPPPPPTIASAAGPTSKNWMGITALILGIVGIVASCCLGSGLLFGAGAVVLGVLGKNAVKAGQANNGGMAQTGLILGGVAAVLSIAYIVFFVVLNVANFGYSSY